MIYLDNNATTPVDPEALDAMLPFFRDAFANPSGAYAASRRARQAVDQARGQVADLVGADPAEIVFTSGGTESNTTAILSAVRTRPEMRHVVTCVTEHPAILVPLERLAGEGWEVTLLGVDRHGRIDLEAFRSALRPGETALASIMWANNETGALQPVLEAAEIARSAGVLFHTDAVQAAGKIPLRVRDSAIHFLSLSGHKLHGPKGAGALFVDRNVRFRPLFEGGGQEGGRRSGTENVPGIVGLGAAAAAAHRHLAAVEAGELDPIAVRRDRLEAILMERITGVHRNTDPRLRTPNTASLRFEGAEAEGLLILLDRLGVCASAGSACHTGALRPSAILTAMGLSDAQARSTLRLSLSRFTTDEDVDRAADAVISSVARLRSLRPSGTPVAG